MSSPRTQRLFSWPVLAVICLLLPPVGLVLLWLRPETRAVTKLLLSAPLLALTVVYAFRFTPLRLEVDGSGMMPVVSWYDPESHFDELERSRDAQPGGSSASDPVSPAAGGEGFWTEFRGPGRDGRYPAHIRTDWPEEGLPRLWRQPVGGGYASFAIAGGVAFTIEQRREQEVVVAYDVETGSELWTHGWNGHFSERMGGDGPRATPTWSEGRVYALGALGELRCLDAASGELVWRHDILAENGATNLHWAMAASPLVTGDLVVVQPGGPGRRSVVAYDKVTGEPVWSNLDDVQGYTSPMVATLGGVRQLLVVSADRALGLAIDDGSVLWEYAWVVSNVPNITQPVLLPGDRIFLSASYDKGSALFEVKRQGDRFTASTVWESSRMKTKQSTAVFFDGYIYGLDEKILACLNAETGELVWKGGRYGYGQILLGDGHLVVLTEKGEVALVEATPEGHREVARFQAVSGKTWNAPAIADGRLLVRNATEMAGFDISG